MASILESFGQVLQPEIVGQFGKTMGLDGPSVTKGLGVVGPLLTSALAIRPRRPRASTVSWACSSRSVGRRRRATS